MQITKKQLDTIDHLDSEYISKVFIKKMVSLLLSKDYINKTDIELSAEIAGTDYSYDSFAEFDNNVSPKDHINNVVIIVNHAYKYEISIYINNHFVCFELSSSTLSEKQADCIIADIREDFYYLLDCTVSGKEYEQTKQYSYSIRNKTYDERKRKPFVWYKSTLFWTIAGVAVALLSVVITVIFQIIK